MENLQLLLCTLLVFSGICVCFLESPVESVLFLILTFCLAAINLLIYNVEFLGLLFIIIYVGAIAVLFLFVIMMLNIKTTKKVFIDIVKKFFLIFILISLISYFIAGGFLNVFNTNFVLGDDSSIIFTLDSFNNIESLGQTLYNYFLTCVLIAGLILLVALLGAIILTSKFNKIQKAQNINRQLIRKEISISFFK